MAEESKLANNSVLGSDVYKALFSNSNDPQYVLDRANGIFLEVNESFEKLSGYTRKELIDGKLSPLTLMAKESVNIYEDKRRIRPQGSSERYEIKMLTKSGQKSPIELSVRRLSMNGIEIVIGSVRDLTQRKKLEQEMWDKIQELGFANNRILTLTEKIRRLPELMPELLQITDEGELLAKTSTILCDRQGLGYSGANFYFIKDGALEMVYSTDKEKDTKRRLPTTHKFAQILRGELQPIINNKEGVLPLKGRDTNIGVLEVFFHPKEISVFEGNERAKKAYQDLLITMSEMVGLIIENLHLYETVKLQSIIDQLTGVYNRRHFDNKLKEEMGRAARYNRALALILMDVDKFKDINDTYGHKQGDMVLVEVARLLKQNSREVDVVCRYGGDEFAIVMPETAGENAAIKAEHIRKVIGDFTFTNVVGGNISIRTTISVGIAGYSKEISDTDAFVNIADKALYSAKKDGKNRIKLAG